MIQQALAQLFERDLNALKKELEMYTDETLIWKVAPGISNSAGNLALHLVGNLNHFIGTTLGSTNYVRNRDAEFALKDIPRKDLIVNIDKTIAVVNEILTELSDEVLEAEFPLEVGGQRRLTKQFLIHLYGHLSYHLGQINYHRRLLS